MLFYIFISMLVILLLTVLCCFLGFLTVRNQLIHRTAMKQLQQDNKRLNNRLTILQAQAKELHSSLEYAQQIQKALLPHYEQIRRHLPLSFIFYKPKELVGGDFFWFYQIDSNNFIIVCADCTGHGIPGAFMTMIANSFLNQIVIENGEQNLPKILSELDRLVRMTLKQNDHNSVQDGLDLSIVKIDKRNSTFDFCSAKHKAFFIKANVLVELRGDRCGIGGSGAKHFNMISHRYDENDTLYLLTDGYIDQFGGSFDKKYSTKQFCELITTLCGSEINQQFDAIKSAHDVWKGQGDQTDDITVIGIRF